MKLFTIGFTKTSAQSFFTRLKDANVKSIIDVRLNTTSQLAGFAKQTDLAFFAKQICNIDYHHMTDLAPTKDMLDEYRNGGTWNAYEQKFIDLMAERQIENLDKNQFNGACLLCSEDKPHYCHRRLVAEYLQKKWSNIEIIHL